MNELVQRGFATQQTLDSFRTTKFIWGQADCIVMARAHLERFGYELPKLPAYRSAIGAKKALKTMGAGSTVDLIDQYLDQIAPANMLVGDLAALEGEHGLEGIAVCNGNMVSGWHETGDGFYNLIPQKYVAAWRVKCPRY